MKPSKEDIVKYKNNYQVAAKHFGVTERTIRRWMQKYGIYKPKPGYGPGKLDKNKSKKIRQLYRNDYTQTQIAEMFGVTQAMVGRIVNNIAYKTSLHLQGKAEIIYNGNKKQRR